MRFERGQLVYAKDSRPFSGFHLEDLINEACIVVRRKGSYDDMWYEVWSIQSQRRFTIHERDLSPLNPQEAQNEV